MNIIAEIKKWNATLTQPNATLEALAESSDVRTLAAALDALKTRRKSKRRDEFISQVQDELNEIERNAFLSRPYLIESGDVIALPSDRYDTPCTPALVEDAQPAGRNGLGRRVVVRNLVTWVVSTIVIPEYADSVAILENREEPSPDELPDFDEIESYEEYEAARDLLAQITCKDTRVETQTELAASLLREHMSGTLYDVPEDATPFRGMEDALRLALREMAKACGLQWSYAGDDGGITISRGIEALDYETLAIICEANKERTTFQRIALVPPYTHGGLGMIKITLAPNMTADELPDAEIMGAMISDAYELEYMLSECDERYEAEQTSISEYAETFDHDLLHRHHNPDFELFPIEDIIEAAREHDVYPSYQGHGDWDMSCQSDESAILDTLVENLEIDVSEIVKHFLICFEWASEEYYNMIGEREAEQKARVIVDAITRQPRLAVIIVGLCPEQFGHDLYLTAAGHGCGIDDGRYEGQLTQAQIEALADAASSFEHMLI